MKKLTRRVICLLLAAIMAFGLCACGNSANTAKNEEAKKYVYHMEDLPIDILEEGESRYGYAAVGDRLYILAQKYYWEEMTGMEVNLLSCKLDGSDVQRIGIFSNVKENPNWIPYDENYEEPDYEAVPLDEPATMDVTINTLEETPADVTDTNNGFYEEWEMEVISDTYVSNVVMDENGVVLILESSSYGWDENGNYVDVAYAMDLYSYDLNGNERFHTTLNDNQDEYMWFRGIASDKDGTLALISDEEIIMIDGQGNPLPSVQMTSENYIQDILAGRDGKLCLISYNEDWTKIFMEKFDMQTKKFEEQIELPGTLTNYSMRAGKTYDFLLTNAQGVYGYNVGDADVTQIINYINSDIDSTTVNQIMDLEDGTMLCFYSDEETWSDHYAKLTPVAPEDVVEKQVISLACNYLDYYLRKHIIQFNKTNSQYRVMVKDYSVYNTMEDYTAGETKLNNDILAGNIPDIMVFNGYDSVMSNYIAKGLLTDIGKMIEEDETLNMADYMTNVFDAYSVDGKLYSVIPSFSVQTVLGKTSMVGEVPGWTLDDLKALMAEYPEATAFGDTITRSEMISYLLMYAGSTYVDQSTGKCYFDSPEFISTLEFVAQFPEEFDWENVEDDYWVTSENQYRDGRTLLMNTSIYDLREYNLIAKGQFGEAVTPIGFPASEGTGSVVIGDTQYGISASSKNKEGAWEFLKYFLSEEYQCSDRMSYRLPVLKAAMEAKLEKAMERPYWEYDDGTKEYYDDIWWVGDQEIIIEPMTEDEAQYLYDFLSTVNKSYLYDEDLNNIITEEVAPYFEGHKSVEDVVAIIQSRAQVYINENR